jgi:hypothetical protein
VCMDEKYHFLGSWYLRYEADLEMAISHNVSRCVGARGCLCSRNYKMITIWYHKVGRQGTLHLSVYIDTLKVSCPYWSLQVCHDARLNNFKSCF